MSGRVVVLTGATGGIGGALAEAFAGESLVLLGRDPERLSSLAADIRVHARWQPTWPMRSRSPMR